MTPAASFDGVAPYYHMLERITFGSLLQQCRIAHLARMTQLRRALILGDGDGRFLESLLQANSFIEVVSVDRSAEMISLARRRVSSVVGAMNRAHFSLGDARTAKLPDHQFDLVVTNFFLDCFPPDEIALILDRVLPCCSKAVVWLDGDFRLPSGGWSCGIARLLLAGMYFAFRLCTGLTVQKLSDPTNEFATRGFSLVSENTWLRGFLSSRLWLKEQN